ncbi:ATP-binding protein [Mycoplasma miroungigenitalium]|uniref:ATP-binding protein n=1 Tax=Mycoplasma miroungigenitalium TaxID=754515 RepID=A0A6M4J8P9_9MOLU|nr:DEAD/DEAH box helicase [Mycoplasma miroungigenitalium]QJR43300.1 ATP-binding protein [Mycoplasma miroungigenitalium]
MFSENEKRYKTILSNLLDVSPNDKAVFTKVDNNYFFDLHKLFSEETYRKIWNKKEFKIEIIEEKLKFASQQLSQAQNYEEALNLIEDFDLSISDFKLRLLKKDFEIGIKKITEELQMQFQKQSIKWKMFLNRAKEINEQTNIWPIHLGFMYIKVNIDGKSIYGPLFLKEAYVIIENARPKLYSNSDIKPNEKLLFLLNNDNFDLDTSMNISDLTIKDLIDFVKSEWENIYPNIPDIFGEFEKLSPENVLNESLEFCPGVVLGLFQPAGGYIRNRMMEIIKNDDVGKIIKIEFKKSNYTKAVDNLIFNPRSSIFKITPTNFSQDKAIASSLQQNTVIWGPPGTGKSQTIVNLLTNILVYGKTAVVCSQKKAALEVIRNRMGMLKPFCLFMLNSAEMSKKSFFKPLKEYIDYIEQFDSVSNLKALRVLSKKELRYIENIANFSQDIRFGEVAKILPTLNKYMGDLNIKRWEVLLNLPDTSFFKYPNECKFDSVKQIEKWMLKNNKLCWKFWSRKRKDAIKKAEKIFEEFNNTNININELKDISKDMDLDHFNFITSLLAILPPKDKPEVSDQNELKKYIAKLIIDRVENLSDEEKEDYGEFALTIRLGKTEPYKFVNRFSNLIKKLFPVIIVTPEADLSAWNKEEFDYAVLDESSQIFIEKGLPVLYLAKTKVLAGDDQQMKPSNWFGIRVTDEDSVYGITESLLDYALGLGIHSILLNKNYRSNHAALMTFSSKHFYKSSLDVIDSAHVNSSSKPIEVIEAGGEWIDNQNAVEAKIALDLISKSLKEYKKIILLCFNAKQQEAITKTIFENHPEIENALKSNQLLLRNIENIQGDEADLVIASLGYDSNAKIHSTYVGRPGGKNSLNVAISRAKEKMIVIKSLHSSDINVTFDNDDVYTFKKWLEFLELSDAERKEFLSIDLEETRTNTIDLSQHSNLFNEIHDYLLKCIENKPWIQLFVNNTLGTLNVDFSIKSNDQNIFSIVVDDYNYANNPAKYLEFQDLCKFIEAKNYKLFKLDRLNWEYIKQEITDLINNIVLNEQKLDDTLDNIEYIYPLVLTTTDSKETLVENGDAINETNDNSDIDQNGDFYPSVENKEIATITSDYQEKTIENSVNNEELEQISNTDDVNESSELRINDNKNLNFYKKLLLTSSIPTLNSLTVQDLNKPINDVFADQNDLNVILDKNEKKNENEINKDLNQSSNDDSDNIDITVDKEINEDGYWDIDAELMDVESDDDFDELFNEEISD